MPVSAQAYAVLRSAGVALVLDITGGRLPVVLHWGADVGELTRADLDALAVGGLPQVAPNGIDAPVPVSVLPEHWAGWMGRPGLSGSRAGRAWSPRFALDQIVLDGVPVPPAASTDGASAEPAVLTAGAGGRLVVTARDAEAALAIAITIELDASGVIRLRAELTNESTGESNPGAPDADSGPAVYQLDELSLALPVPQRAAEVLDFAGRWGKERAPQRVPVRLGTHLREGRHGRTGADSAMILHVGEPGFEFDHGEVWGLHVGWSGNHRHFLDVVNTGEQLLGGGELLLPGEIRLLPGQSYTTPWLYAVHGIGLDDVARRFHRLLRARPNHPKSPRPVTLNVWEAVYFDHSLPKLLALAEQAAALGVERYVLDDGWFGSRRDDHSGLGDWTVSQQVWPDGLHPLIDRVRALGMQFGLWVEPEMVNPDSDLARAHPEWVMAAGARRPVESRFQQVLNLGIPECYQHLRDALCALLDEYEIGYLKWDHNRDLIDAGTLPNGAPGVHEQTLAFYRLVDELKVRYPGLEIESCSSGGARVDLGVLARTDRIWVSDNIDPLDRLTMNRWTTQLVPPELMGSHVASGASHTTGRRHSISFRAASALFGHLGVEWDLTAASADELAELAAWIAFYREHRGLLHGGDVVRLDHPDPTVWLHGVVAPDRSAALYCYASTARSALVTPGRLVLPGLDPRRRYRVEPALPEHLPAGTQPPAWWRDRSDGGSARPAGTVLPGAALGSTGLQAPLIRPETAVVYQVREVSKD